MTWEREVRLLLYNPGNTTIHHVRRIKSGRSIGGQGSNFLRQTFHLRPGTSDSLKYSPKTQTHKGAYHLSYHDGAGQPPSLLRGGCCWPSLPRGHHSPAPLWQADYSNSGLPQGRQSSGSHSINTNGTLNHGLSEPQFPHLENDGSFPDFSRETS